MNKVPIPKKFKLFGQTFNVIYNPELQFRTDNDGEMESRINTIVLQPRTESIPIPEEQLEQKYLHELTHNIFTYAGREDLSENEEFVDLFSNLLHQALQTSEYNEST